MSAGSEPHHLLAIAKVRMTLVVFTLEPGHVDQQLGRRRQARQWRDVLTRVLVHCTGQRFTPQISDAYSAMVRSLENFPDAATFRMALWAQARGSRYSSPSRSCAWT